MKAIEGMVIAFTDSKAFERWLKIHHTKSDGIWLKFYKKASGKKTVVYKEALDVALSYGWIDSQLKSLDTESYIQRFTPRRKKSMWSQVNREHVARLIAEGRMHAAGLAEVARAKSDGRWDAAYGSSKTMMAPPDFKRALLRSPRAKAFYATLNRANTYAILWRIHTAKNPAAREKCIVRMIHMLEKGERIHKGWGSASKK